MKSITLRDVIAADLPVFYAQQCEPAANEMSASVPRNEADFMEHWKKTATDPAVIRKTILDRNKVAGYAASFMRADKREVCYWLGQAFWNKGIATQALADFLKLEQRRPLYAGVAQRNLASIRVLEKCGFSPIGQENYPNLSGTIVEGLLYAINLR